MTRLEEIEGAIEYLKTHQRQLDFDGCEVGVSRQALECVLFALDCYKARVAVLEEALRLVKHDLENCDWGCVECGADPAMEEADIYTAFILPVIDLTPEECLERQVGEEG